MLAESKLERFEGDVLGGDEKFARESGFTGPTAEGFFGRKKREIGVVVFLGHVREYKIASAGVEAIGIAKVFADRMIGEMTCAGEHALLHNPWVRAYFEHVQIVVGFEDEAIGFAEMNFDEFGHIAEVGADGDLGTIGAKGETDGIDGVMRNGEGMNVDIANRKALTRLNGFDAAQALAKSFRENAFENAHCGLGDIKRSLPETEDLRETIAVIGVLVGDQDGVEMSETAFDGSKTREGLAFAEASVHEDAGTFRFEQGEIARTAGRKNRDAQADWNCPLRKLSK